MIFTLVSILASLVIVFLLWKIPIYQLKSKKAKLKDIEYLNLENEFRRTIAQIIGGLVVLAGLYFTWDQISATKKTVEISQETLITDRYSKAIDQLGSNNSQIRLGGIFALEKIAYSNTEYVSIVDKVLATYVRTKSNSKDSIDYEELQESINIISDKESNPTFSKDTTQRIDISNAILRKFNFDNSFLTNLILNGSDLSESSFKSANLSKVSGYDVNFSKANLTKSVLSKSIFYGADFTQATLNGSTIKNVNLRLASLKEADLTNCDLEGSDLSDADLTETLLYGADLSNTRGLTKMQLNKARINNLTKLPANIK